MPPKGGNKHRKFKKGGNKELIDKLDKEQMFAKIIQNNGNHFSLLCSDNIIRRAPLSNTVRKGARLFKDNFVVISLRDFENNQTNCDILGIGNPPVEILQLLKKNNSKKDYGIEFNNSDDEYDDLINIHKDEKITNDEQNDNNENINSTNNYNDDYFTIPGIDDIAENSNSDEEYNLDNL